MRENQGVESRVTTWGEVAELSSERWGGPEQVEIYRLVLHFVLSMLGSFQKVESWGMWYELIYILKRSLWQLCRAHRQEDQLDIIGIFQADDNRELNWDVCCRSRKKGKDLEAMLGMVPIELARRIDVGIKGDSCILDWATGWMVVIFTKVGKTATALGGDRSHISDSLYLRCL